MDRCIFSLSAPVSLAFLLATVAVVPLAQSQEQKTATVPKAAVLISADTLRHDKDKGTVAARGNVEIVQNDRVLRADSVVYDSRSDTVVATGNVAILEPSGEVLFADRVELQDQLRSGTLTGLRALLTDNSRVAANTAVRRDGNKTIMTKAVYSPCNLCPDHPEKPPLWQLKAVQVEHNQQAQRIDYKDVILEVYGIPVAYSPFFSHPDPTVDRKSGFLAPSLLSTTELGTTVTTPYYYVISPDKDFTVSPTFTTKEGIVLAGEYRQRTHTGEFSFDASITRADVRNDNNIKTGGRETRGHIRGNGNFNIDETWRWGFNLFRSSDDTYLRRYSISGASTLTSDIYAEGFRGKNYASAHAWSFQGLSQEDTTGNTSLILPFLEFNHVGEPGRYGQRFDADASFLLLNRTDGTDSRRLSGKVGWHLPHTGRFGDVYTLEASVGGDAYFVNSVVDPNNPSAPDENGVTGRLWPKLSLEWRLPLVRNQGSIRQVIEPILQGVITPNGGNSSTIPNEDSQSFEFDDTNLFSENRFPGLDRVEGGPRLNYGLKASVYGDKGGHSSLLVGQVLRARDDSTFEPKTGLNGHLSDYVGRIVISPSSYFEYTHRFRLDKDSLSLRRNEIGLTAGPEWLKMTVGYVKLDDELSTDNLGDREELRLNGLLRIDQYWRISAYDQIDLSVNGGTLLYGAALEYLDECLSFRVGFDRKFTRDRDVEPTTNFGFQIKLVNLG